MNKFNYITSTNDGNATAAVSGDYIASKIANRTVGMIALADDDTMINFSLSDGSHIKFRLRPHTAEVVYYAPDPK